MYAMQLYKHTKSLIFRWSSGPGLDPAYNTRSDGHLYGYLNAGP